MKTKFQARLIILWKESKLTMKDYAKKIDVRYTTLIGWFTDKVDPRASSVAHVARMTNVSADWLLGLSEKR